MSHSAVLAQRSRIARVVVADDHDLARAGLRGLLSGERGIEVVGEAASGREALELCRRVRPDLVLMDVRMPDMNGLAVTPSSTSRRPPA
jgi:YesN/AraC family two-component response regulator